IMNGGNKIYIHKDGFGDVYDATPEEEAEWAEEVIAASLLKLEESHNSTDLENAINNLRFHRYQELNELLVKKFEGSSGDRKSIFAAILSRVDLNAAWMEKKKVTLIYANLCETANKNMYDVFAKFADLK